MSIGCSTVSICILYTQSDYQKLPEPSVGPTVLKSNVVPISYILVFSSTVEICIQQYINSIFF